jgi:hypothetical protein
MSPTLKILEKLEPEVCGVGGFVDQLTAEAAISQTISLKRIADALEKQNEISEKLLEVQNALEMSTRGLQG